MDAKLLELIEKSQAGNAEAFAEIYDIFVQRLFRFIKLKIQNQQQAEDILQETFVKVWGYIKQFRPEGGSLQAWIYKITANTINDYFRKIYRQPETLELLENLEKASEANVEKEVGNRLETEGYIKAFELLGESQKQVLELRLIQDLSILETAKILGKSNLAVRVLFHRALKKLRKIVSQNNVV